MINIASKKKKIKNILRGYYRLKKNKNIGLWRKVRCISSSHLFKIKKNIFSNIIFGSLYLNAEKAVSQFVIQKLWTRRIKQKFFETVGTGKKHYFPMPYPVLKKLSAIPLPISFKKSKIYWWLAIAGLIGSSLITTFYVGFLTFFSKRSARQFKKYAFFENISKKSVPSWKKNHKRFDVFNWYSQSSEKPKGLKTITHGLNAPTTKIHNIDVRHAPPPWTLIQGAQNKALFLSWIIFAVPTAIILLCLGQWWSAVMLAEAAKAKAVSLCSPDTLAEEYLFAWSGNYYRPLWTYEAEKKKSKISLFLYSSMATPTIKTKYSSKRYEWGPSSWPRILVWNKKMKDYFLFNYQCKAKIKVVGPIWFEDSDRQVPYHPTPAIAVFNLEIHRLAYYQPETTLADWSSLFPNLEEKFLFDIQKTLEKNKIYMVWKNKRDIGERRTTKNKRLFAALQNKSNVVPISPDIAPQRILKRCLAVISMPFTSTALIGRQAGFPSVFYDPTGYLMKDDPAALGVPLVSGLNELEQWIARKANADFIKQKKIF